MISKIVWWVPLYAPYCKEKKMLAKNVQVQREKKEMVWVKKRPPGPPEHVHNPFAKKKSLYALAHCPCLDSKINDAL